MTGTRRPLPGGRSGGFLAHGDVRDGPPARRGPWSLIQRFVLGALGLVGFVLLGGSALLATLLYNYAHPRVPPTEETPATLFLTFEEVAFPASDGQSISAWWIPGRPGMPSIILAHDRGATRASLLGLAARLAEQKHPLLLPDFRGHGASGGNSSFGVLEKRDLLGAVDWIASRTGDGATRVGIVGVGMGAHAAILAAAERPQVRCLALDTPYPDAHNQFLAAGLPEGFVRRLVSRWSELIYDIGYRVRASNERAADVVGELSDRNLLFLAPKDVERAAADARALYESVSEARHNFKNLLLLPATRTTALYGTDRDRYDQEILSFFRSYLPPPSLDRAADAGER